MRPIPPQTISLRRLRPEQRLYICQGDRTISLDSPQAMPPPLTRMASDASSAGYYTAEESVDEDDDHLASGRRAAASLSPNVGSDWGYDWDRSLNVQPELSLLNKERWLRAAAAVKEEHAESRLRVTRWHEVLHEALTRNRQLRADHRRRSSAREQHLASQRRSAAEAKARACSVWDEVWKWLALGLAAALFGSVVYVLQAEFLIDILCFFIAMLVSFPPNPFVWACMNFSHSFISMLRGCNT